MLDFCIFKFAVDFSTLPCSTNVISLHELFAQYACFICFLFGREINFYKKIIWLHGNQAGSKSDCSAHPVESSSIINIRFSCFYVPYDYQHPASYIPERYLEVDHFVRIWKQWVPCSIDALCLAFRQRFQKRFGNLLKKWKHHSD